MVSIFNLDTTGTAKDDQNNSELSLADEKEGGGDVGGTEREACDSAVKLSKINVGNKGLELVNGEVNGIDGDIGFE
jgi:hypothetical protein